MSPRLRGHFLSLQERLRAELRSNEALTHPTAKGDSTESDWVRMLAAHLPARYCVNKAFVMDSAGELSEQIDVVIYDRQYCPLLLNRNDQRYVPAESVYAVLEVRQDLGRENLLYAGTKAGSVRRQRRTSAAITHAGGTYDPRHPFRVIAGILCTGCSWASGLGPSLENALLAGGEDERLDLGCALDAGGFEAVYPLAGGVQLTTSAPDTALMFFFLRLLGRLQEVGTAPAIDYREYGRALSDPDE